MKNKLLDYVTNKGEILFKVTNETKLEWRNKNKIKNFKKVLTKQKSKCIISKR